MNFNLLQTNKDKNYNSDDFNKFLGNFFEVEKAFLSKIEYTTNKGILIQENVLSEDGRAREKGPEFYAAKSILFTAYENGKFRLKVTDWDTGLTCIEHYGDINQTQFFENTGNIYSYISGELSSDDVKRSSFVFDLDMTGKFKERKVFRFVLQVETVNESRKKEKEEVNLSMDEFIKTRLTHSMDSIYRANKPVNVNNLLVSESTSLIILGNRNYRFIFGEPDRGVFYIKGHIFLDKVVGGRFYHFKIFDDESFSSNMVNNRKWGPQVIDVLRPKYRFEDSDKQYYEFCIDMGENPWNDNNPWRTKKEKEEVAMDYVGNVYDSKYRTGTNCFDTGMSITDSTTDINGITINQNNKTVDLNGYTLTNSKEEKMKDRFSSLMPAKVKIGEVAMTMNGTLAVKGKDGNYVSYNKETKQITDNMDVVFGEDKIAEMCYLMPVDIKVLKVGDIINSNGSYCYVESVDKESGKTTFINFATSVREDVVGSVNIFTQMSTVRKLISFFDMAGGFGGTAPAPDPVFDADGKPVATAPSNSMGMNPMMMMMLMDKKGTGDNDMMKMMMMGQMMGGMNGDMNPMMMMMFMDKM